MPNTAQAVSAELDQLLDSELIMEDPYPIYRRLREERPLHWSERWNAWVVSGYDQVVESLRDNENLSNEDRQALLFKNHTVEQQASLSQLRHYFAQKDVIASDPPDHTRMRKLVQRAFTPRTVSGLADRVRNLAVSLLADHAGSSVDLVEIIAHPLPVIVIAELLGAPAEDRPLFRRWSADILAFQGTGTADFEVALRSQASLLEMFGYMGALLDERRKHPRGDLITALAQAEDNGERLSRDELLATCNTLLTAGHETTTNLLGNLVHLLLKHRRQWESLAINEKLIPAAIEEALRYDAPKQRNFRRVKRTHEVRGKTLQVGQLVFQLIGSANRDPAKFAQPDSFDISRGTLGRSEASNLAFGSGLHFCLGAPLARMEARIVLETLLRISPSICLADRKIEWQARVQFRGPRELWVDCVG